VNLLPGPEVTAVSKLFTPFFMTHLVATWAGL